MPLVHFAQLNYFVIDCTTSVVLILELIEIRIAIFNLLF